MLFLPAVVTTTCCAGVDAGAGDGVAQLVGVVLGHLVAGQRDACTARRRVNSMPKLRPLKYRPSTAATMISPEMAYQSRVRPTKSIDLRPV